jgi:alcohol dehydrogenase class IV
LKGHNVFEFKDFSVNPKLEEARVGYELFKQSNCDLILAVGGGSIIDMSKIIKQLYLTDCQFKPSLDIPLIAIPTTAGTGSEATHFAVVYINGIKDSYAHKLLLPSFAIVDANLLQGQSKYQMAVSGIDAFAQGIESIWSINSTEESERYSENAIKLIWENLKKAIDGDYLALSKIAEGSNWAGKAINIAKTTAPHALSYSFTSLFGLPHGHAVSLTLTQFIDFNYNLSDSDNNDPRGKCYVKQKIEKICKIVNCNSVEIMISNISNFFLNIGLCATIKIPEQKEIESFIKKIINNINIERLKNNPRRTTEVDLYRILKPIFHSSHEN